MKNVRFFLALMMMTMLASKSFAQLSPVDFMRNNPRAVYANAATYTVDDGFFDLLLGGINFGLMNQGLKYDNFFKFNDYGQPVALMLNDGIASLGKVNYLNTYLTFDIFNCGRRTRHGYFNYAHRMREIQSFSYSRDFLQLIAQGNGSFIEEGRAADINFGLSARVFQEFDFGFQMSLLEQLNIGMRLKFLVGTADANVGTNFALYTDPNSYAISLHAAAEAQATIPYQLSMDNGSFSLVDGRFNIANLFKNYGLGVDMGAEYQINEYFGVAAAINDLGYINWNNFSVRLAANLKDGGSLYHNDSIVFSGLTSEQLNGLMNNPGQVMDSLMNYYDLTYENMPGYRTGLNTNLMVRGYYDADANNRFSLQLMGYNTGMGMQPAVTLGYTGSFAKKFDLVATYTMMKGSYDNIGVGLSANFGGLLMYIATNNLLAYFNPANRSQLNLQLGVSLTSGELTDRSEMVIVKIEAAEAEAEKEEKLEPKVEPKEEPKLEPKIEPIVEPKLEPEPEPQPEPVVTPEPEPEPQPEPVVEPVVEPQPEPQPEPVVTPEPEPEPQPEPVVEPVVEPQPEPQPEPVPTPEP